MSLQRVGFYVLLVLVTLAFFAVMLPFYSAVLWAVVFALVFYPLHRRIEAGLGGRRSAAACISVLVCLCVVIIPGLVVLSLLVQQGNTLYNRISSGEIDIGRFLTTLQDLLPSFVRERLQSLEADGLAGLGERLSSALMQGGGFFAGRALTLGQNTVEFVIAFGVMLYLLFFLFRDGQQLARTISRSLPLSDAHTLRFTAKFAAVIRATVRGNVIIAVAQGAIGGLAFWALGLAPALLWGVVMALLSLLPAVGAALIWAPAAAYLLVSGDWIRAGLLVAIGVLVIGLIDNLLRPPLVGKETRLPDYMVLISTLGGLSLIGINGFVLGPLVAALFVSAWGIVGEEEPSNEGSPRGIIIRDP